MNRELIVIGAGGHAKVVVATARAAGWRVVAAFDDDPARVGDDLLGVPIRGPVGEAGARRSAAILAIGSNRCRARLAAELSLSWVPVVHPDASVHASAQVGAGTVILAGAVVQPDARIEDHSIVNTGASVDHDCFLGAFSHVAPGVHLSGDVQIHEGAFVGVGAAVVNGVSIGAWATLGAGGVAIRDIPPAATAVGVPARVVRG